MGAPSRAALFVGPRIIGRATLARWRTYGLELSSVCVMDAAGRIVREAKVASEPEALIGFGAQIG